VFGTIGIGGVATGGGVGVQTTSGGDGIAGDPIPGVPGNPGVPKGAGVGVTQTLGVGGAGVGVQITSGGTVGVPSVPDIGGVPANPGVGVTQTLGVGVGDAGVGVQTTSGGGVGSPGVPSIGGVPGIPGAGVTQMYGVGDGGGGGIVGGGGGGVAVGSGGGVFVGGTGVGVGGGGIGVGVGGTGVAVGGTGVFVGGTGVAVGGRGVGVGGTGVFVGGTGVGGIGVAVGGMGVFVGIAVGVTRHSGGTIRTMPITSVPLAAAVRAILLVVPPPPGVVTALLGGRVRGSTGVMPPMSVATPSGVASVRRVGVGPKVLVGGRVIVTGGETMAVTTSVFAVAQTVAKANAVLVSSGVALTFAGIAASAVTSRPDTSAIPIQRSLRHPPLFMRSPPYPLVYIHPLLTRATRRRPAIFPTRGITRIVRTLRIPPTLHNTTAVQALQEPRVVRVFRTFMLREWSGERVPQDAGAVRFAPYAGNRREGHAAPVFEREGGATDERTLVEREHEAVRDEGNGFARVREKHRLHGGGEATKGVACGFPPVRRGVGLREEGGNGTLVVRHEHAAPMHLRQPCHGRRHAQVRPSRRDNGPGLDRLRLVARDEYRDFAPPRPPCEPRRLRPPPFREGPPLRVRPGLCRVRVPHKEEIAAHYTPPSEHRKDEPQRHEDTKEKPIVGFLCVFVSLWFDSFGYSSIAFSGKAAGKAAGRSQVLSTAMCAPASLASWKACIRSRTW